MWPTLSIRAEMPQDVLLLRVRGFRVWGKERRIFRMLERSGVRLGSGNSRASLEFPQSIAMRAISQQASKRKNTDIYVILNFLI